MIARLTVLALTGATLLTTSVARAEEFGKPAGFYMVEGRLYDSCRIFLKGARNGDKLPNAAEGFSAGTCFGFVVGVMDVFSGLTSWDAITGDERPAFCTTNVNAYDATETVALYLEQHPEDRDKNGYFLVRKVLNEKFPC